MDLIEHAKQDYAIMGKTISVYTLDGEIIKGKVVKVAPELLDIENEKGFFVINKSAIASMFISKDVQKKSFTTPSVPIMGHKAPGD